MRLMVFTLSGGGRSHGSGPGGRNDERSDYSGGVAKFYQSLQSHFARSGVATENVHCRWVQLKMEIRFYQIQWKFDHMLINIFFVKLSKVFQKEE